MELDRNKLQGFLSSRGLSLKAFARQCGISRQSIYNMMEGKSVFSKPLEKIMAELGVELDDLMRTRPSVEAILEGAPRTIQRAALQIQEYVRQQEADLFLIGSRARGKKGIRSDWDFAIFYPDEKEHLDLVLLKQRCVDAAFPHRIGIVNITAAPKWFLQSIAKDALRLEGSTDRDHIFNAKEKGAA